MLILRWGYCCEIKKLLGTKMKENFGTYLIKVRCLKQVGISDIYLEPFLIWKSKVARWYPLRHQIGLYFVSHSPGIRTKWARRVIVEGYFSASIFLFIWGWGQQQAVFRDYSWLGNHSCKFRGPYQVNRIEFGLATCKANHCKTSLAWLSTPSFLSIPSFK